MASNIYTTIRVTQADIDRSMRKQSARCVIATAVARSIPDARNVTVDLQTIRFSVPGEPRCIYLTPPAASGYVIAYDAGDEIHPFAFRLSERHRVTARSDKRSESGKARRRVKANLDNAERTRDRAQAQLESLTDKSDPLEVAAVEHQVKEAKQKVARRKRERRVVEAEHADKPQTEPDMTQDDNGVRARKPPARAFKYNARGYGSRALRINQDDVLGTPENEASRRAVMAVYDEGIEL